MALIALAIRAFVAERLKVVEIWKRGFTCRPFRRCFVCVAGGIDLSGRRILLCMGADQQTIQGVLLNAPLLPFKIISDFFAEGHSGYCFFTILSDGFTQGNPHPATGISDAFELGLLCFAPHGQRSEGNGIHQGDQ